MDKVTFKKESSNSYDVFYCGKKTELTVTHYDEYRCTFLNLLDIRAKTLDDMRTFLESELDYYNAL